MLDTSALIGLHEAHPEVATYLAGVLQQLDDKTVQKTHQAALGELWTGVLVVGDGDDSDNPRRPVLETAVGLDIETIEPHDAVAFARITAVTNRSMSHNDRWIRAAAIRTRSTLITQDARMAEQLGRYFASFDLLGGEPRTLQDVADHFELKPSRIAQIEKRALERLRSASD